MEQPETETEIDDITISLDDTLESLKRNAYAVDVYFNETKKKLKAFQQKIAEESNSSELRQPRTRMVKWLTDRSLSIESTFIEFFETFIEEHKQDERLDLSQRSIRLNTSACILFGFDKTDSIVSLYDLLAKVDTLYY